VGHGLLGASGVLLVPFLHVLLAEDLVGRRVALGLVLLVDLGLGGGGGPGSAGLGLCRSLGHRGRVFKCRPFTRQTQSTN